MHNFKNESVTQIFFFKLYNNLILTKKTNILQVQSTYEFILKKRIIFTYKSI